MQMMPLRRGAALAPMAGATDKTMRRISAGHGAVCTVSEMISAKALTMGDKKARSWFWAAVAACRTACSFSGTSPL